MIDEHSRLCLAIRVGRRCKAKDVVAVLEELTSHYPAPAFIRSDNGPEFIAHALWLWCQSSATATASIKPGSPWQNGFVGSFNSRFRDAFLNIELFATVAEVQGWATAGAGRTHPQAAFGPPGVYAPGGSSAGSCSMTTSTHSDKAWTDPSRQLPCGIHPGCRWAWIRLVADPAWPV